MLNRESGAENKIHAAPIDSHLPHEEELKKQILEMRPYIVDFITKKGFENIADDIAQTALVKGINGVKSFKGESALKTWLTRIALNELYMGLRTDKRHGAKNNAYEDNMKLENAGVENFSDPILRKHIESVLHTLKPQEQEIIKLSLQNSDSEIAEKLNVPYSTAKTKLFRARKKIRQTLADRGIEIDELGISKADL
jgi:RNA polymerase sigma-70 factor (ECF subfamily)